MYSNRNYVNTQPFNGPLSGLAGWAGTRRNIHPLTPTLIIKHPLSVSSVYYFPWHPPCSFYVFDINITKKVYCINVGKKWYSWIDEHTPDVALHFRYVFGKHNSADYPTMMPANYKMCD